MVVLVGRATMRGRRVVRAKRMLYVFIVDNG
jgi:hypothetical protein